MNKQELIEWLQLLQSNGIVKIYDPNSEQPEPITGATYDANEIILYSDDLC